MKKFLASLIGLLAFVAPAVFATAPAQAWGEVTYPGVGYALSNTTWRDVVYCQSQSQVSTGHWLEIAVDSTRVMGGNGPAIDPYAIRITRIKHNSSGQHVYVPLDNGLQHKIHIQQRYGPIPQTLTNEWNPGWISFNGLMDGESALFSQYNLGLNWTNMPEASNPNLYFSGYLQYTYVSGGVAGVTNELFQNGCTVDLGA